MKKAKQSSMRISLERGRTLVKRGKWWHLETHVDGVRYRRRLGEQSLEAATRKALEADPAEPPQPHRKPTPAVTVEAAAKEYLTPGRRDLKESSRKRAAESVGWFVAHVGAELDTRALTREEIQAYVNRKPNRSPITIRNDFGAVRAFLNWTSRQYRDSVDLHALKGIDLPRDTGIARPVPDMATVHEVLAKLRGHAWLGDFVKVMLETGARPGEVLAARAADVDGEFLHIRPYGEWSPKSKWSVRKIRITPAAAAILKKRKAGLDQGRPIFCDELGAMRPVKGVSWAYRAQLREGGRIPSRFKWANLYSFRHLFSSVHAQPGPGYMPIDVLSKYLGHSPGSSRVLERYYIDRAALDLGAPPSIVAPYKTKVRKLKAK